jgi:hypothetical protein
MNKTVLMVFAGIFGIIGAYVPFLFGDTDLFGGWSIFMGMVGGLFGIWLGVWVSKRLG